jgi:hypothetical protein
MAIGPGRWVENSGNGSGGSSGVQQAAGESAWHPSLDALVNTKMPRRRIKPEVEVGNKVLILKWSGNEITVDGEEWLFIRESDILAIVAD